MAGLLRLLFFSSAVLLSVVLSDGEDDLVVDLPGLLFKPNFNVYSGYLNANAKGTWKMHYWLTESRNDPANDPLLVWFNGGPGCSSFCGMFEELGPFYVTQDGQYLFENVHSWNQRANVLALESPIGVGFSYDTTVNNFTDANDDQSAAQNFAALNDFFARVQPKYKDRTFFLSGESYAGIYIPMLSDLLIQAINAKTFSNPNFQGAAIGNGFMDLKSLVTSTIIWSNFHGRFSVQEWDYIKQNCSTGKETDVEKYDLRAYMKTTNGIDYRSDGSACGKLAETGMLVPTWMDQYNYYQDCYAGSAIVLSGPHAKRKEAKRRTARGGRVRRATGDEVVAADGRPDHNPADDIWQDSTDTQNGYPCWNEDSVHTYANRDDVQKAIHISDEWRARKADWVDCNDPIYSQYHGTYDTMRHFFDRIFTNIKIPNFRMMIYNGDADTVCNYLGDAWFMREVADGNGLVDQGRSEWSYRNQTAGFQQRYLRGDVALDVITVKGAGHFVPADRPGQSAQFITNFVSNSPANGIDYSSSKLVNPTPKPLPMLAAASTTAAATTADANSMTTTSSPASSMASLSTAIALTILALMR